MLYNIVDNNFIDPKPYNKALNLPLLFRNKLESFV